MPQITITTNTADAQAVLRRIGGRRFNSEILDSAGLYVRDRVRRGITQGINPVGTAHPPNKAGTPVLRKTGRLLNSINYRVTGSSHVTIGTNVVYSAIHQFGGIAGRGARIPPRPYFPLSADGTAAFLPTNWRTGLERNLDAVIQRLVR